MDFRSMFGRASDRIRTVFSRDNSFFYGSGGQNEAYAAEQDPRQTAPTQGVYPNTYQQAPYGQRQGDYQAAQPLHHQPVQQGAYPYQQQTAQAYAAGNPQQAWQGPQAYQQQYAQPYQQPSSPQQMQLNQMQGESVPRNRRAAQHVQEQPQQQDNIVQFPGAPAPEPERPKVDAYVVNITNITGCRQAMSCLRKGQCTLVVMDQLVDKAEVRRYVDMLNGACFALGGTMTRLSLRVGFYLLAPSGMMVYTDPMTASANMPQSRPAAPQQTAAQQPWTSQGNPASQAETEYQAQPNQQPYQQSFQQPVQPVYQPQAYAQPGSYAPAQGAYAPPAQFQGGVTNEYERYAL